MTELGRAVQTTREQYDVIGPMGDSRIQSLPAGSNLLVCGPTMVGKSELTFQALHDGYTTGSAVIAVLSNESPTRLTDFFEESGIDRDRPVHVVDCTGRDVPDGVPDWLSITSVSSPGDLTGIGIANAKVMRQIGSNAEDGVYLGLVSLSTLLQYAAPRRVFNFAHVMTGRVAAGGYLGTWTLDTDAHEPTTVNTLKGLFRYVAEVRETADGTRELRVLGGPSEWRTWQPID